MNDLGLQQRDLTLMFTDIVGYSRLMGRDQVQTIDMLEDYQRILVEQIEKQRGNVIEFIGDSVFAHFDTPQEAVTAAVEIQKALFSFNHFRGKSLPQLRTRIGLHCGNVATKGDAVLGDDVNIAARLEPVAVADGICISQAVYDVVKDDLTEPVLKLGVLPLKNIESKIRVYLIRPLGITFKTRAHYINKKLGQKLGAYRYLIVISIILLIASTFYWVPRWLVPGYDANYVEIADFKNLNEPEGAPEYYSIGISDAIRSQLANMRDVYIVDNKEKMNAPIGVEGSILRVGENLRIEYRIFRRKNNIQIVGGKLDGRNQDILILQDRLVGEVARYLAEEFEIANFRPAPLVLTDDVSAYDYYLKGKFYLSQQKAHQTFDQAIQMFNTALVHDDEFVGAFTGLCEAYRGQFDMTSDVKWIGKATSMCNEALRINPDEPKALELKGLLLASLGDIDGAIKIIEQARKIEPQSASIVNSLAAIHLKDDNPEKAEILHKAAMSQDPDNWKIINGYAFFLMSRSRYAEAIELYEKILDLSPENLRAIFNIGTAYVLSDNYKKAILYWNRASDIKPDAETYSNIGMLYLYMNEVDMAKDQLKQALELDPDNVRYLVNLGQCFNQSPGEIESAKKYFDRAIKIGETQLISAPGAEYLYHYMAIANALSGNISDAKELMKKSDGISSDSADSEYTKLLIAVVENEKEMILLHIKKLLETGYSKKLFLSDPNFKSLRDRQFVKEIIDLY